MEKEKLYVKFFDLLPDYDKGDTTQENLFKQVDELYQSEITKLQNEIKTYEPIIKMKNKAFENLANELEKTTQILDFKNETLELRNEEILKLKSTLKKSEVIINNGANLYESSASIYQMGQGRFLKQKKAT